MVKYAMLTDVDLCIGCQACEIACKQENHLPVGPRWVRVVQVGPDEVGGKLKMSFAVIRCAHCAKPVCIDACPVQAITKRYDGIVLINPELCIGCGECAQVCPRGAPQFNPETNVYQMCTMCAHRIDKGLKPACALACPSEAIRFGDTNQLIESKREKYARNVT